MLDSGFTPRETCQHLDGNSAKWSYGTAISEEVKVHLACVKMGHLLSVHALASVKQEKHTAALVISISTHVGRGQGSGGWVLLRPAELARVFKDGVAHRLLTDIRKGEPAFSRE
jgi:hypothetical protein